jgi:hypothetical protein
VKIKTEKIKILVLVLIIFFTLFFYPIKIVDSELINSNKQSDNSDKKITPLAISNYDALFLNYSKTTQRRIFFDMTHDQVWEIEDTGFFGYSKLNILLQKYFLEVSPIRVSLSETVMNMTSEDILFLNIFFFGEYSEYELNNITAFIERGGKAIILGEHNILNITTHQNPLLRKFDMEVSKKDNVDNVNNVHNISAWNIFNSSFFGLINLSILYGGVLDIWGNAFAMANASHTAKYPNAPIIGGYVHNNSKGGKVLCITDTEWIWNGNITYCGIDYGNNSQLVLKILDWFYNTTFSEEVNAGINVIPEYNVFTAPKSNNFTLNLTLSETLNVSIEIEGGSVFPLYGQNMIGTTNWNINVSSDGYIKFIFSKTSLDRFNFSRVIYFFEGNYSQKILFMQYNYSRSVNPKPNGLLKFALELKSRNYSVFSTYKLLNYSNFDCVIVPNPLEPYSSNVITSLNESNDNGTRVIFMNSPFSSLLTNSVMANDLSKANPVYNNLTFRPYEIPINRISSTFGINFSHYIISDYVHNFKNKFYFPKIAGANSTFYNLTVNKASIINVSSEFTQELMGYNGSYGDDRSIHAFYYPEGFQDRDINYTCVLAYTNKTLGLGILNYFINEYFEPSKYFNDFFFNWINTGEFNRKYQLISNQTTIIFKDTHFNLKTVEKIKDRNGTIVPNGTIFNVRNNKGLILTPDAAPNIAGFQVKSFNGSLNLTLSSGDDYGFFELSIYNSTNFKIILSIDTLYLNFTTRPNIDNIIFNPNGTVILNWTAHPQVKTYYIFRSNSFIDNTTSLNSIDNVTNTLFTDNLTLFGVYYYAIIGSNYTRNTTISNCVTITIGPILNNIASNPNYNGSVELIWDPLIGATTYYVFRDLSFISETSIQNISNYLIGFTSSFNFVDSNTVQNLTYYYVIMGSNLIINSTLSNCVNVTMNIIPVYPTFQIKSLIFNQHTIRIEWPSVQYATEYKIYTSRSKNFTASGATYLMTVYDNWVELENYADGYYYFKIKTVGLYGESGPSEELTVFKKVLIYVDSDNPLLLITLLLGITSATTITIFSYFWLYLKKQERNISQ